MKVFITGINGFIGSNLRNSLEISGISVSGSIRNNNNNTSPLIYKKTLTPHTKWLDCLIDVDVVIHTAATAHEKNDNSDTFFKKCFDTNKHATINLADQCEKAGVKKLIFLSSTGVNGPQKTTVSPYKIDDDPNPHDIYTKSKYEAEIELLKLDSIYDLDIIILRAPVVYGLGAKGSFGSILNAIENKIPLPFKSLKNKRDFLHIDNLISLVKVILFKEINIKNKIFFVSDCSPLTLEELCVIAGKIIKVKPWIVYFPISNFIFYYFFKILRLAKEYETLTSDFRIETLETQKILEWSPVYNPIDELAK